MPGHVRGRKHLRLRAARDGEKALRPKPARMERSTNAWAREWEKALTPEGSKRGGIALMP
jgi:hypothetical protein